MSLKEIAALGKMLALFLALFADCFKSNPGSELLQIYVQGLLSDVQRKNAEAIAANQNVRPRTLQRFLDSIKWDHARLRDRCQQIIATDHAGSQAVGIVDESGTAKSGHDTVGVKRQYNGNRSKVENCINRSPMESGCWLGHLTSSTLATASSLTDWTREEAKRSLAGYHRMLMSG